MPNKFTVKIDERALLTEFGSARNKAASNALLETEIKERVEKSRDEMLEDIESHPVSREISEGPNSDNKSNTLGGYGNLFSFIGFNRGSDPVEDITTELRKPVKTKVKRVFWGRGKFTVDTNLPSQKEVESKAQIPWANGLSWAEGIEKGISGLGQYFFKGRFSAVSRSGTGVQGKSNTGRSFRPTQYLTKIYKDFFERIKR